MTRSNLTRHYFLIAWFIFSLIGGQSFAEVRYVSLNASADAERAETNIYVRVNYTPIAVSWPKSELESVITPDRTSAIAVVKSLEAALIQRNYTWFQQLVNQDLPKLYAQLQQDPSNEAQNVNLLYGMDAGPSMFFGMSRLLSDGSTVPWIGITSTDTSGDLYSPLGRLMNPLIQLLLGIIIEHPSGIADHPSQLGAEYSGYSLMPLLIPESTAQDVQVWMNIIPPTWGANVTDGNLNYVTASEPPEGTHGSAVAFFRESIKAFLSIPNQDDFRNSAEYSTYLDHFGEESREAIGQELSGMTGEQLAGYKFNLAELRLTRIIGGSKLVYICYRTAHQPHGQYVTLLLDANGNPSKIVNANSADFGLEPILGLPAVRAGLWP